YQDRMHEVAAAPHLQEASSKSLWDCEMCFLLSLESQPCHTNNTPRRGGYSRPHVCSSLGPHLQTSMSIPCEFVHRADGTFVGFRKASHTFPNSRRAPTAAYKANVKTPLFLPQLIGHVLQDAFGEDPNAEGRQSAMRSRKDGVS